jgi:hypothetical protein
MMLAVAKHFALALEPGHEKAALASTLGGIHSVQRVLSNEGFEDCRQ